MEKPLFSYYYLGNLSLGHNIRVPSVGQCCLPSIACLVAALQSDCVIFVVTIQGSLSTSVWVFSQWICLSVTFVVVAVVVNIMTIALSVLTWNYFCA